MKLSEVQSSAAALVNGNATLAASGPALVYDPLADVDATRKAIADRLREAGFCIEIGGVEADGDPERPSPRFSLVRAGFDLWLAESPTKAHSPSGLPLVELVSQTIQRRTSAGEHNFRCVAYAQAIHEQGYVLHILSFSIPAIL